MGLFDRIAQRVSGAFSRVFSRKERDLGGARQAELRGELAKAAALFGRAGATSDVARIMILRAEAEPDPRARLPHYVQAASIAPEGDPLRKIARIRRAQITTLLAKSGAMSAAVRADVLRAARELEELGEAGEAADAYRLGGDHEAEARALAAAGKIEELETLLDHDQAEVRRSRQKRSRLEEIDLAIAGGRRREALALAKALLKEDATDRAARERAATIDQGRITGPIVRIEIQGKKALIVIGSEIVIGRSEGEIQISSHAVSRRHLRVARRGDQIVVADLESRNGTTLRGIAIGGEIPIGDGVDLLLGNEVPVRIAPSSQIAGAISIDAGGSSYVAPLGAARVGVGDWELSIGVENWIELAFASPAAYLSDVVLASPVALLQRDEISSQRRAAPIVKFF